MAGILDLVKGASPLAGPIGMGVSAAATIFGAIKGAKAQKEQQRIITEKQEENQAQIDLNGSQSFLDTAAAKDAVKAQNESLIDGRKAVEGRAVITGASDEAKVAGQTGVQKSYNDAISRLAAAGTQYQQNERRIGNYRKDTLDNQQMALNAQKADSAANLVANAGDLMGTSTMNEGMNDPTAKVIGRTPLQTDQLNKIAQSAGK